MCLPAESHTWEPSGREVLKGLCVPPTPPTEVSHAKKSDRHPQNCFTQVKR